MSPRDTDVAMSLPDPPFSIRTEEQLIALLLKRLDAPSKPMTRGDWDAICQQGELLAAQQRAEDRGSAIDAKT